MAGQLLDLCKKDAGLPLLDVITELIHYLPDSFFLVSLDLEVDVAMAVLCLAKSDLIEKLSIPERLLVAGHDLRDKVFRHLGCSLSAHFLFSLSVFLRFALKLLRIVQPLIERSSLVRQVYAPV